MFIQMLNAGRRSPCMRKFPNGQCQHQLVLGTDQVPVGWWLVRVVTPSEMYSSLGGSHTASWTGSGSVFTSCFCVW